MKDNKREFIEQYVQTKLTLTPERQEDIINKLDDVSRIQWARKYQELESEGRAEDGRAWLSVDAMTHSFYYCKNSGCHWGNQIWKKFEPILFSASLINGEYRKNNIQMLEPGWVLSISYPDLLVLRDEFLEIERHIEHISMMNEEAYHSRIRLLNEPYMQRVLEFEEDNPLFSNIATKTIRALHLGLTRQGYNSLLRKIRNNSKNQ